LTSVVIGNSVTSIGSYALYDCDSLKSVVIGNSVTSIGNYAFYDCDGLTEIVIPESVTSIGEYAFRDCTALTEMVVPNGVTSMGQRVFYGCTGIDFIGCVRGTKPSNWNNSWNALDDKGNVIPAAWGYTGEMITYTFVTPDGTQTVSSIGVVQLPAVEAREGYVFVWYDNAEFAGDLMRLSGTYYSATKYNLYGKWMTDEEYYWAVLAGTSMEYAIEAQKGGSYSVVIDEAGEYVYFVFTATENGSVTIQSSGSYDTYGHLYDVNGNQLTSDDDSAGNNQFRITYNVVAGQTYYIGARMYGSIVGSYTLVIS
jgi:hypothetical protein